LISGRVLSSRDRSRRAAGRELIESIVVNVVNSWVKVMRQTANLFAFPRTIGRSWKPVDLQMSGLRKWNV
jgi:hypothetical protein